MEPNDAMDGIQKVDTELINDCIRKLRGRFTAVHIFCSRESDVEDISVGRDQDHTISAQGGSGNLHARVGHCKRWLTQVEELDRIHAREDLAGPNAF